MIFSLIFLTLLLLSMIAALTVRENALNIFLIDAKPCYTQTNRSILSITPQVSVITKRLDIQTFTLIL